MGISLYDYCSSNFKGSLEGLWDSLGDHQLTQVNLKDVYDVIFILNNSMQHL